MVVTINRVDKAEPQRVSNLCILYEGVCVRVSMSEIS